MVNVQPGDAHWQRPAGRGHSDCLGFFDIRANERKKGKFCATAETLGSPRDYTDFAFGVVGVPCARDGGLLAHTNVQDYWPLSTHYSQL